MTHNTNTNNDAYDNLLTTDSCQGNRSAFRANRFQSSYSVRIKS